MHEVGQQITRQYFVVVRFSLVRRVDRFHSMQFWFLVHSPDDANAGNEFAVKSLAIRFHPFNRNTYLLLKVTTSPSEQFPTILLQFWSIRVKSTVHKPNRHHFPFCAVQDLRSPPKLTQSNFPCILNAVLNEPWLFTKLKSGGIFPESFE